MSRTWTALYAAMTTSARCASLPDDTCRFFYTQLLLIADGYGSVDCRPHILNAKAWPLLQKPTSEVVRVVTELARVGLIFGHMEANAAWLSIPDWEDKAGSQLRHSSKADRRGSPEFPSCIRNRVEIGLLPGYSGNIPETPPDREIDPKRDSRERDSKREMRAVRAPAVSKAVPNYHEAIAVWCECFQSVTGQPYGFDGGKDGKHVKAILGFAKGDLDAIRNRALILLNAAPGWIDEGGKDLGTLRSQWNKLVSQQTGQATGAKLLAVQEANGRAHPTPTKLEPLPTTKRLY